MPHRCAFGCKKTDVVMHVFPDPIKFPERFKAWVNLVGGKLDTPSDFGFYKKKSICDIHFTVEHRSRFKRLNTLAIPSLFLPGSHDTLHKFPNPIKDKELFNSWVYSISGDILEKTNDQIFKYRRVCHQHFEEKYWCRNNRISIDAIPTLNMPGSTSTSKFIFGERRLSRSTEQTLSKLKGMHRVLHGFPNPKKDTKRFNEWLYAVGSDILGLENERIFKYRRVCHSHFEERYLCRNNKISNIAVPTLNIQVAADNHSKGKTPCAPGSDVSEEHPAVPVMADEHSSSLDNFEIEYLESNIEDEDNIQNEYPESRTDHEKNIQNDSPESRIEYEKNIQNDCLESNSESEENVQTEITESSIENDENLLDFANDPLGPDNFEIEYLESDIEDEDNIQNEYPESRTDHEKNIQNDSPESRIEYEKNIQNDCLESNSESEENVQTEITESSIENDENLLDIANDPLGPDNKVKMDSIYTKLGKKPGVAPTQLLVANVDPLGPVYNFAKKLKKIQLNICQICLRTDRKARVIDNRLSKFHSELCDTAQTFDYKFCTECEHMLKKLYNFKAKCKRADAIFKKWMRETANEKASLDALCTLLPPTSLGQCTSNQKFYNFTYEEPTRTFKGARVSDNPRLFNSSVVNKDYFHARKPDSQGLSKLNSKESTNIFNKIQKDKAVSYNTNKFKDIALQMQKKNDNVMVEYLEVGDDDIGNYALEYTNSNSIDNKDTEKHIDKPKKSLIELANISITNEDFICDDDTVEDCRTDAIYAITNKKTGLIDKYKIPLNTKNNSNTDTVLTSKTINLPDTVSDEEETSINLNKTPYTYTRKDKKNANQVIELKRNSDVAVLNISTKKPRYDTSIVNSDSKTETSAASKTETSVASKTETSVANKPETSVASNFVNQIHNKSFLYMNTPSIQTEVCDTRLQQFDSRRITDDSNTEITNYVDSNIVNHVDKMEMVNQTVDRSERLFPFYDIIAKLANHTDNRPLKLSFCKKTVFDSSTSATTCILLSDEQRKRMRGKPKIPFSKKRLLEELKEMFSECGELKTKDGATIHKEFTIKCIEDKVSEPMNREIWDSVNGRPTIEPHAIRLLNCIQRYKDDPQYQTIFNIQYLNTKERVIEEFEKRKTYDGYVNSVYKCETCFQGFKYQNALAYHQRIQHKPGNLACSICGMKRSSAKALKKHTFIAHEAVYYCKSCPFITHYRRTMINHYHRHLGVKYKCDPCGLTYKSKPAYLSHMREYHRRKRQVCTMCGRAFLTHLGLTRHVKLTHKEDTATAADIRCEECDLSFSSPLAHLTHIRNTHPEQIIKKPRALPKKKVNLIAVRKTIVMTCRLCNAVGTSMGWLSFHFRTEHPSVDMSTVYPERQRHLCHICGKGFKYETSLRAHTNRHIDLRPYPCGHCGKCFHNAYSRNQHRLRHFPPKYICSVCGKTFHTDSNLYCHMRIHKNNRCFKCNICFKGFIHKWALDQHIRGVHQQVKRVRKRRQTNTGTKGIAVTEMEY